MATRRMSIWGAKPPYPNKPVKEAASPPRMEIPQFKTVEEVEAEKRKEQHENPKEARPEQDPQYNARPSKPQSTTRSKRRSYSISICVSEEEETILRKAASDQGMTFSGWARQSLFKATNKKIPKRHP